MARTKKQRNRLRRRKKGLSTPAASNLDRRRGTFNRQSEEEWWDDLPKTPMSGRRFAR